MVRGTLIVFEGLDRAGKSTQCVRLVETLRSQGRAVRHIRFPGTSKGICTHLRWLSVNQIALRLLVNK